jgi:MerR family transcriptional regulator, light-induced transcriptional regulator
MMHPFYQEFLSAFDQRDKVKCVRLVLAKLESQALDVVTLYDEILTPAQSAKLCRADQKEICVWEEHVRTSIVRTIIECCFPYVIKERAAKYGSFDKGKAVVLCPPEELHEIGARMVADFFMLCGFDTVFIGANTPQAEIVNAIRYGQPRYAAISITNCYNLVAASDVVKEIMGLKAAIPFQIILGGQACKSNPEACRQLGADLILETFEDIQRLQGGLAGAGV